MRPSVQRVLDALTAPAWIRNDRADVVAANALGRALYAPLYDDPVRPANTARFTFLSPQAKDFYRDWDETARDMVAVLRAAAGHDPYDKGLSDLVGELSTRSELFRTMWATHDVLLHRTGTKNLHHPVAGDLDLTYEAFELPSEPGLRDARLHRRTRHADRASPRLPGQLGRDAARRRGDRADPRLTPVVLVASSSSGRRRS